MSARPFRYTGHPVDHPRLNGPLHDGGGVYKAITPVVQTVEDAGVASRVARLWPLMTVKG
ncbi:MAG: hypothetical protein CMH57_16005 [Myxococcales bacterium]|nr:hypothetical protein [Myxococcales bacterium]